MLHKNCIIKTIMNMDKFLTPLDIYFYKIIQALGSIYYIALSS